jgi:hypothetical protein
MTVPQCKSIASLVMPFFTDMPASDEMSPGSVRFFSQRCRKFRSGMGGVLCASQTAEGVHPREFVMTKKLGYGIVVWAIPYVTAIPLMGLMRGDETLLKTIMVVEGSIVGAAMTAHYFLDVRRNFLREGIWLGVTWLLVNWALDVVGILPFAGMALTQYFAEIGLRYLGIFAPTVAVGYVLGRRLEGTANREPLRAAA